MKMVVKFIVLLAFLLMLNGVAFALIPCDCYEFTAVALDSSNPEPETLYVKICFDYENNIGLINGLCNSKCIPPDQLYMFFDSMKEQALTSHDFGSYFCLAYLKFHGDNQYALNGILDIVSRHKFTGHKITDYHKCDCEE